MGAHFTVDAVVSVFGAIFLNSHCQKPIVKNKPDLRMKIK